MGRRAPRAFLCSGKKQGGETTTEMSPEGGRHTALQQTTGGDSAPDHAVYPGNRQAPSPINGRTSRLITGTTFFEGKGGALQGGENLGRWEKSPSLSTPIISSALPAGSVPLTKFFGVEGEREGEAAPFVHKRGASPSQLSFSPTAGDPAHAGRWPRPHGRERWRPCPPDRRWCGQDAARGCRRGRKGPGHARPAP